MKTRLQLAVGLLLLLTAPHLQAQEDRTPDPLCAKAEKLPIPKADMPPPGTVAPKTCDPLDLQSSPGHPIDLRQARYCAYAARAANPGKGDDMQNMSGSAGLAMIYAGGKGVPPNLQLAIRFACEIQGGWDDGTPVAKMLEEKRTHGTLRVDFDICETPTGRQLNFTCLLRNQGRVAREITAAEKRFNLGPPQQQTAFRRLRAARDAFLSAHSVEEPNGTTGAVQSAMQDEIDIDHAWVDLLDRFSAGKLPQHSKEDYLKADADLNDAYQGAQASAATCNSEFCVSSTQLLALERAWLAYRDAWVAYATIRWPAVSADSWRTWLTLEQTEDLKNLEN
jgi:uncharacterized protein YecT (DUF1311 family)